MESDIGQNRNSEEFGTVSSEDEGFKDENNNISLKIGHQTLNISGNCGSELLETAKLILEDYFSVLSFERVEAPTPKYTGKTHFTRKESEEHEKSFLQVSYSNKIEKIFYDKVDLMILSENDISQGSPSDWKYISERFPGIVKPINDTKYEVKPTPWKDHFSRNDINFGISEGIEAQKSRPRIIYTIQRLMYLARSRYSIQPPKDWKKIEEICPEIVHRLSGTKDLEVFARNPFTNQDHIIHKSYEMILH